MANDFHVRASVDTGSSLSDHGSPPPMQRLSLGSPQWQPQTTKTPELTPTVLRDVRSLSPMPRHTLQLPPSGSRNHDGYRHPPSPGHAPKSAINPIFKVVSPENLSSRTIQLTCDVQPPNSGSRDSSTSLPPFSYLEAVADGECPPLSPMAFTIPEDMTIQDDH